MVGALRTRRDIVGAAGPLAGGAGLALLAGAAQAQSAAASAGERANLKLVGDFCAAWPAHDLAKLMAFFSDNPTYRQTETQPPAVGREAVSAKIDAFLKDVVRFDVHDSWARGPMVINERSDFFTGRLKLWRGVGVFLIKDGKIVEWHDYTIEVQRA